MSKQGQEQFEFQHPLLPATPFRPTLPKPPVIHAGRQENCVGSERCSCGFTEEFQTDRVVACSDSTCCTELNGGVNNLNAALVGSNCISGDSNGQRQYSMDLAELSNVPFADLLALANAASAASTTAASEGINKDHAECSSAGLLPMLAVFADVIPPENPYGLNLPSGTSNALSHTSIPDFALDGSVHKAKVAQIAMKHKLANNMKLLNMRIQP